MHAILEYLEAKKDVVTLRKYEDEIVPKSVGEGGGVRAAFLCGWYKCMVDLLIQRLGEDNVLKLYGENWPMTPRLEFGSEDE